MLDFLRELLTSEYGSFGFVFALLCLVFWLVFKSGKIVEKFSGVEKLENNIDKIKEDISEIKAFISVIRQEKSQFAKSHSPVSLTEKGVKVSKDIYIKRAIDRNWSNLLKEIKNALKEENNPYDIQEFCFQLGNKYSKYISEDDFDIIKKYAFSKGYNLSDFDIIFGIEIRDKYFSENNINVIDIDIHDPNKKKN